MAVFLHEGEACRLEYAVVCDAAWQTRHAWVAGWLGSRRIRLDVLATADRRWHLDGRPCAELDGCMDVDLAFTPSTNLLPIRRLAQVYRRTGPAAYRYETEGGAFATDLEVDADGFVRRYGGGWELVER